MRLGALRKGELISKANQLYEIINERKEEKKSQLISQGLFSGTNSRVSYEFIEMDDLEDELIQVFANYYCMNNYGYSLQDERVLLKVGLAGMCQLIKSPHYMRSYRNTYRDLTGLEPDNKFYSILEEAFSVEGILPPDWELLKGTSFRYKDVLVNEAGIPENLISDLITFFLLYWKYFRSRTVQEVLNEFENKRISDNFKFENKDFNEIKIAYKSIKEYPRKVVRVITQLSEVCELLQNGEYNEEEINNVEVVETINHILSFDMFRILPRKDSLKTLYSKILNQVTPDKFRKILSSKPTQLLVKTPEGEYIKNYNYDEIQLGEHSIANITYNVVLDRNLSANELINWPYEKLVKFEETFGYRSITYFRVTYGMYRGGKIYPLYHNGIFQGYFWYGAIPKGLPVKIGDEQIQPSEPIYYNAHFKYYWDENMQTYQFKVSMTDIRLYIPQYKNRQLTLKGNFSNTSKDFLLDSIGTREIEKFDFNIDCGLYEENRTFTIYLKESCEHVKIKDLDVGKFNPIYCFSKANKSLVSPREHLYGNSDFLVFISPGCHEEIIIDSNVATIKQYPTNIFRAYRITWEDSRQPLSFCIGEYKWTFKESVIFYLRDIETIVDEEELEENLLKEYTSFEQVNYELVTNLPETELRDTYLVISYGEGKYREVKLASVIEKKEMRYLIYGAAIKRNIGLQAHYIGRIILSFSYKQKRIYEQHLIIFPSIMVEEIRNLYIEGEGVEVKLTSDIECFYHEGDYRRTIVKRLGTAKISSDDDILKADEFISEELLPDLDRFYSFKYTPSVLAYRFVNCISSERKFISTNTISYNDLEHYTLEILGRNNGKVKLFFNSNIQELLLDPYGIIQFNLKSLKDLITRRNSRLEIKQLDRDVFIQVKWEPKVYGITQLNTDITNEAGFEIDYEGPSDTSLLINLVDNYGDILHSEKLTCLGKRTKLRKLYEIPDSCNGTEILINIAYEFDEDSLISQLVYKVVTNKWYNDIEMYSREQFVSDMKRYSSITGEFVRKKIKGGR